MKKDAARVTQRSLPFMLAAVSVWWVANTIATIASKSVMRGGDGRTKAGGTGLTMAFKDMRWVELTAMQHLLGAALAAIWVKATGKAIWPTSAKDHKHSCTWQRLAML